jgi:alpha-beta hydrolase superfamily lysophospholipase
LYNELVQKKGYSPKPCLFGRSRGGLWVSSWAIENPTKVSGIIGIYPVFDFRTYPGIDKTAPAYGLSKSELESKQSELNPISRISVLAKARIPVALIHGDIDKVVPLKENSQEFFNQYKLEKQQDLVKLIILKGQGHNFFEGFFNSQELVDFAIAHAKAGTK